MMHELEREYLKLRDLGLSGLEPLILNYAQDKDVSQSYELGVILYDGRIKKDHPDVVKTLETDHNYYICAARHGDDGDFTEIVSIEEGVLVNHAFDVLIPKDINTFSVDMLPLVVIFVNGGLYFVTEKE